MANYNTFIVMDCKLRRIELVTSSARKAERLLSPGHKIEVWNGNDRVEVIRDRDRRREPRPLGPYVEREREFIAARQSAAEERNRRRKA